MRILSKKVVFDGATTVSPANPTVAGAFNPVGDADRVLVSTKCTGTTSCTWSFWTWQENEDGSIGFSSWDQSKADDPSAGIHTIDQGELKQPLSFEVKGCDGWTIKFEGRTFGDEVFTAMGTLVKD